MEPRKFSVAISVFREKNPIEFAGKVESFTYTDYARDSSDDVSVRVNNYDYKWLTDNALQKGDRFAAVIMHREDAVEEQFLNCGDLILDDISYSGRPLIGDFRAQSAPIGNDWKTRKRERNWSNTGLKQVSGDIASTYGLQLIFEGEDQHIDNLEQDKEADSTFLKEQLDKYGYSMKVYSQKLIVYQDKYYESKDSVIDIFEKDLETWNWNTSLVGSYTGAHYNYTNSDTGETYDFSIGSEERVLEVSDSANSLEEARRITISKLNKENRGTTTLTCTLKIPAKIVATTNISIKGLGIIDGKYFVDKVTHNLGKGYYVSLELSKIEEWIGA